ncbi:fumarylacetoacetate hydrolase family protein [Geomesophilobacter sediminis]|uniref:Fumarylacetoacetate hydrolase family protein n=1 Tax=Geomesophilobacter sediminis TaxID=2798584 RepID=A0A8J7JLQ8_9BACT|nr:fumarylacetoacetate hydrolase family protein [Geomesophilobacter sediminis]MBJ6725165.1 fumarylacetoacetate hydrolase family protein [Geomesophilobacter sediminis]
MKIATYWHEGMRRVGRLFADGACVSPFLIGGRAYENGALALFERLAAGEELELGDPVPFAAVQLDAPLPRPRRNIFCVGKNYHAHAREFAQSGFDTSLAKGGDEVPTEPIIFSKVPESVIAPGAAIRIPAGVSDAVDYEAELAVVIGRGGRGIPAGRAMEHVWGYTIVNDVTARDWQQRHKQWLMGKSFDTFCPMGPWLVSADEFDGADTRVRCWVNGELRQDARTTDLIFPIPKLIETISAGITLYPGDIIATGTPAGVGIGFQPPRYLQPGDLVRIEIDGIGVLENPVVLGQG